MNGQECYKVHIQSSFFVAMLFAHQSHVGARTSLSANVRKTESNGFPQTNDNNETLADAMQHTDHASFNENRFESTHHIVHNKKLAETNSPEMLSHITTSLLMSSQMRC